MSDNEHTYVCDVLCTLFVVDEMYVLGILDFRMLSDSCDRWPKARKIDLYCVITW